MTDLMTSSYPINDINFFYLSYNLMQVKIQNLNKFGLGRLIILGMKFTD